MQVQPYLFFEGRTEGGGLVRAVFGRVQRRCTIVTEGVYRWTRNPMYLGMALIYLGFALLLDSLVALILIFPLVFVIQKEVIEREERYMEAKFGDAYRDYKARVRRWI